MGKSASAPAVIARAAAVRLALPLALEISALESSAPEPHILCNRARLAPCVHIPTGEQL